MLTQHCSEGEAVSCTFPETVPGKVSQHLIEDLYTHCISACCKEAVCSAAMHVTSIACHHHGKRSETMPCNIYSCLHQNSNTATAELQHHRHEQQPYVGNATDPHGCNSPCFVKKAALLTCQEKRF